MPGMNLEEFGEFSLRISAGRMITLSRYLHYFYVTETKFISFFNSRTHTLYPDFKFKILGISGSNYNYHLFPD